MNYDEDGQPQHSSAFNQFNNFSKAQSELTGICLGILADGIVSDDEAVMFRAWLLSRPEAYEAWPFNEVLRRVEKIFEDGIIDDDEREDLKTIMLEITGMNEDPTDCRTRSSALPVDNVSLSDLLIEGRSFVVTGKFASGTRATVHEEIIERGGEVAKNLTMKIDYLIIGEFASRDWANTSAGRKIEKAVKYRDKGATIKIISEATWTDRCHSS